MPVLYWLDRSQTLNTVLQVPCRVLRVDDKLSYGDKNSNNLLIQGDNLHALKALLPYFRGQVKCMFIDPPYNTKIAFEYYPDSLEHAKWLDMIFNFPPYYPVGQLYDDRTVFNKHYYRQIAKMNEEEAECACVLDQHKQVKYWIRNLERQEQHAFCLPLATGRFYPDFIAQLMDGRILVVEYKGAHLDNSDTHEKMVVGKVWTKASGNLFLLLFKQDNLGRDISAQLRHGLG